jgi:hypothetical protein
MKKIKRQQGASKLVVLFCTRGKTQEMTTNWKPPSSLSSSTFEGKNQEMTTSLLAHHHLLHLRKKKKMMMSLLARRHLLHLRKKQKNDDEPRGLSSYSTPKKKNKKMMMSQEAHRHLLHLRKKTKQ